MNASRRNISALPYAFTEQGIAMLSSVLRSPRAVEVNIAIMRAFVQLRQVLSSHAELAQKLAELERRLEGHDTSIRSLFDAIRQLMAPADIEPPTKEMGFHVKEDSVAYRIRRRQGHHLKPSRHRGQRRPGTSAKLALTDPPTNIKP